MRKQNGRIAVEVGVFKNLDYTPEASRVYAREVKVATLQSGSREVQRSELYVIEAGSNRPDVLLFGGFVYPTKAEEKIRASWPGAAPAECAAPGKLSIDGIYITLDQLAVFTESLNAILAEARKWR